MIGAILYSALTPRSAWAPWADTPLAEHHHVGSDPLPLDEMEQASAVALLLHYRRREIEGHAGWKTPVLQDLRAVCHARDRRQFVDRAAAPDLAVLHLAAERVVVPGRGIAYPDTVHVPVHQDLEITVSGSRDHCTEAIEEHLVEPQAPILTLHPLAPLPLAAALGGDGDHLAEKGHDVVLVTARGGERLPPLVRCHFLSSPIDMGRAGDRASPRGTIDQQPSREGDANR
jgi:hypothetical protein